MKYRIRMDGNGKFIIERKTFLLWHSFYIRACWCPTAPERHQDVIEWAQLATINGIFEGPFDSPTPTRFHEAEHAVLLLQEIKRKQQQLNNERKFAVIVQESL